MKLELKNMGPSNLPNDHRRKILLAGTGLTVSCLAPMQAMGQTKYPEKPIRLVVPVTPGGPSDLVSRLWSSQIAQEMGQSIVVENRSGASHIIGTDYVAKSAPDGYTLLQAAINMSINPTVMKSLPFDTIGDFTGVSLTHLTPLVVAVPADSPHKTLQDLLAQMKADPSSISYGTTGDGSPQQLAVALLAQNIGAKDLIEIAYKGSTAAHPDLISSRLSVMIDPLAAVMPHLRSGALRALAVTTADRLDNLPEVPTVKEAADMPDYEVTSWGAVFAPTGTPPDIIMRLNEVIGKAIDSDETKERFAGWGLIPRKSSPAETQAFLRSEIKKWQGILEAIKA